MKKLLKKQIHTTYYYKNNERIEGVHKDISGDVSGIKGYVSGIYGNVSGIKGDVTEISGDVDNCEITKKDREKGIKINDLIQ